MAEKDFVLTGGIDDRAIIEAFKGWVIQAGKSGADAGKALDKGLSDAAKRSTVGRDMLREIEASAARFPNAISSQLTRAVSSASTPATQLGTLVAKGVKGGADQIPAIIGQALASATSRAGQAGQQIGTAVGTGAQGPLSRLLGTSISTSLASAAGAAQRGGQQIGAGVAGGAGNSLERLLPSAMTRAFSSAPTVGATAGRGLATSLTQATQAGLGQANVFAPITQQGTSSARTLLSEFGRSGAGILASSAGLKTWADEQGRVRTATGLVVPQLDLMNRSLGGIGPKAQEAGRSFRDLASSSSLVEGAVGGLAFALTNALGNAASGALQTVTRLVQGYSELDSELRLAAAAAGEAGGYDRLAESVNRVGIEAAGTTKEVAQLATALVRAGFTVDQVAKAMPGIVRGAEATGTSFDSMGSIVGSTLRGFALDVGETSRVVDVLVNTANSSNASIEGLGFTMQYAAPVAKALNVSLEDLAATSGLMANAGIDASVAGTGLRTGLERLQKAAAGASGETLGLGRGQEQLGKAMRVLGAEITKTNGELLPLDQVLIRLKQRFAELGTAEKVQLSSALFGDEAGSKFLAVLNQTEAEIGKMFATIRNSAGATDKARDAMQSFGLSVKQLQGTVDSLGNSVGQVIAVALLPFIAAANGVLGPIAALPGPVKAAAAALLVLTAGYIAAKVGSAAFSAALKVEAVVAAKTEILGLARSIRTDLAADLAKGAAAAGRFVTSLNAANIAAAAASIRGMAGSLQAGVVSGLIAAADGAGNLSMKLLTTSREAERASKSMSGFSGFLKGAFAKDAETASIALLRVSDDLALLAAGGVSTGVAAIGVALAGVAAAAGSYAVIMQKAWRETDMAKGPIEELEAGLTRLGVPLADTTALGGPFSRFMQDASGGLADFVQSIIPIPGLARALKGALDLVGQALRATPFGMAIEGALKLGGALKKAYDEAQKNQGLVEAQVAFNKLSANAASATNAAAGFIAQVKAMPTGQQLDKGQTATLTRIQEQLRLNKEALASYRQALLQGAGAAKAAGDKEYADELTRRAKATEIEIGLIDVQSNSLTKVTASRRAAAGAAREEKLSLDAVIEALKQRETLNQGTVLEAEAAALQKVATSNLTAAQAAVQKSAATVTALTNEIRLIDAAMAKASAADQLSEKFLQLKTQRAQKVVQLYQIEAQAVEQRITAEQELNKVIAEAPVRALDAQLQVGNALLNLSKALTDLESSRYSLASSVLAAQLEEAQQRGASERTLGEIKARQAQVEAQAARARLDGLARAQALEVQILQLTQRRQVLDANLAINQAREQLLRRELDLRNAINSGNQNAIDAATAELDLAAGNLGIRQQSLGLIQQIQPIERAIAQIGREKALNEAQAAAYTATFKANLADAVKPGGELASSAGRTAVKFSELGVGTQELVKDLSSSNGILGELSRRMLTVSQGSSIAAASARQIGLYGRGSVNSYAGIGTSLDQAGTSAEAFAGSGIDDATNAAASGAAVLNRNMNQAVSGARAFYDALAAASGLPGARWAGGGVEAGGKYRINDGPGMRSLGTESFLSRSGRLSLINRPANSLWTAPSDGVVIPAATTAKLQAQGILPGGGGGRRAARAVAPGGRADASHSRLEAAITTLTAAVTYLAGKDWSVRVPDTSGGRRRQLLHMISALG
jgi:TP901 family phage tail tape measure protein